MSVTVDLRDFTYGEIEDSDDLDNAIKGYVEEALTEGEEQDEISSIVEDSLVQLRRDYERLIDDLDAKIEELEEQRDALREVAEATEFIESSDIQRVIDTARDEGYGVDDDE